LSYHDHDVMTEQQEPGAPFIRGFMRMSGLHSAEGRSKFAGAATNCFSTPQPHSHPAIREGLQIQSLVLQSQPATTACAGLPTRRRANTINTAIPNPVANNTTLPGSGVSAACSN